MNTYIEYSKLWYPYFLVYSIQYWLSCNLILSFTVLTTSGPHGKCTQPNRIIHGHLKTNFKLSKLRKNCIQGKSRKWRSWLLIKYNTIPTNRLVNVIQGFKKLPSCDFTSPTSSLPLLVIPWHHSASSTYPIKQTFFLCLFQHSEIFLTLHPSHPHSHCFSASSTILTTFVVPSISFPLA